ncbi:hypothetical protein [Pseudooceanicola algae]|uniref:DUF995 domain-containing protein n=1 Tax=Pseudooceanicola algae TaxID=1537215 RepID=A0A418SEX4_9RHOB|nr:hypothetical protein [Pseudooceanicola algae]QPM89034.1 hypothetical protein PSAL_002430 [Pseudooceanicola algae]
MRHPHARPALNIPALTALTLLIATPLLAQQAMTAQEFDSYSQGKTFYYGSGGQPYGIEEYLPGRRVRWSFLDGQCKDGTWYEQNGEICFVYEDQSAPQCWLFFNGPDGMTASFQSDEVGTELYEIENTPEPLQCMGPEVGV